MTERLFHGDRSSEAQRRLAEPHLCSSGVGDTEGFSCALGPLRGPTSAMAPLGKLTIPTRMFEVPVFPSTIINKDHEDERNPAEQQRAEHMLSGLAHEPRSGPTARDTLTRPRCHR